jgi:hypothetical protein
MMKRLLDRLGWAIAGALALAVVLLAAKAAQGGPLDPPGPPGSTMKTLADLVPAWHQNLNSNGCGSARWTCVFGNAAVLDNETGLVWEKTPLWNGTDTWSNAQTLCTSDPAGGKYGWRLPTAAELLTLKDANTLDLVAGNPFSGVAGHAFWSATNAPEDPGRARYIIFAQFASNEQTAPKTQSTIAGIWCVRGGAGDGIEPRDNLGAWAQALPANDSGDPCNSARFTCVFSGAAVLDHETGLVWQRDPTVNSSGFWGSAISVCYSLTLAGKTGWRPATIAELMSLLDVSVLAPAVSLPTGHPFANLSSATTYWSTTPLDPDSPTDAWSVFFKNPNSGSPGGAYIYTKTGAILPAWCVRGSE